MILLVVMSSNEVTLMSLQERKISVSVGKNLITKPGVIYDYFLSIF